MISMKEFGRFCSKNNCITCPLSELATKNSCLESAYVSPEATEKIVSEWIEKNPYITYATHFKKVFPFSSIEINALCRQAFYGNQEDCCHDCEKCWNKEYIERNE